MYENNNGLQCSVAVFCRSFTIFSLLSDKSLQTREDMARLSFPRWSSLLFWFPSPLCRRARARAGHRLSCQGGLYSLLCYQSDTLKVIVSIAIFYNRTIPDLSNLHRKKPWLSERQGQSSDSHNSLKSKSGRKCEASSVFWRCEFFIFKEIY